MEKFTYNPAELTEEQKKAIELADKAYNLEMERLIEQENERMERYYNCEDDYSWGGLCTKANYQQRYRAEQDHEERIEEIVRGGFIIRTRKQNVLRSIETGEIVAQGTHEGKFGRYFITEDGRCIGMAKQLKTFENKGVLPYVQTITEKKCPRGWYPSGDRRYNVLEVISVSEELSTEICY